MATTKAQSQKNLVPAAKPRRLDIATEVVVLGSTPGALAAALACRLAGWEVLVIESGTSLGGDHAKGAGEIWLPGRDEVSISGQPDSYATARNYFDHLLPSFTEASSPGRRHAFFEDAPSTAQWLTDLGIYLRPSVVSDYYPQLPGGARSERVLLPVSTEAGLIGRLAEFVPSGKARELSMLDRLGRTAKNLSGSHVVDGGAALVVGLIAALQRLQASIWWDAPWLDFLTDRDASRISGVIVQRAGRPVRVHATRGVVLARGGYSSDAQLRRQFLPEATRVSWTMSTPDPIGPAVLNWADEYGLDLAGLDQAWWQPGIWDISTGTGQVWPANRALANPFGFMVDSTGQRFCNEAAPGAKVCQALFVLARRLGPEGLPAWLIMDSQHRKTCPLGPLGAGRVPKSARDSAFVVSARTLPELAWKLKISVEGLEATAARFDEFADRGIDEDFGRGTDPYDKSIGLANHQPNPCLGKLLKPPFHAVRIVPADQGTKGGLLTDEWGRVLRQGKVYPGLWAISSAAASLADRVDPAPGIALAEELVFGRRVAQSITSAAGLHEDLG